MTHVAALQIRPLRLAANLSLAELSAQSRVPEIRLQDLESGSPNYDGEIIEALCNALSCSPRSLFMKSETQSFLLDKERDTPLFGQVFRDICVEAVTSYNAMNRSHELLENREAETIWLEIGAAFIELLNERLSVSSCDHAAPAGIQTRHDQ